MTNVWVSFKNRHSPNYRFSTDNPNCIEIAQLREMVKQQSADHRQWNKRIDTVSWMAGREKKPMLSLRVRPRGPRQAYAYDTLASDATHYDVYIKEYAVY
ncbi:MAG: hypothetical protein N0C84_00620 [Candidatus Thiodiazotropha taylori]|uniref:Uncharacterized protein n=1 Tax=Candidatus Thiodiazotropha taylori TaxID=2792791 RepID=A0A9E4N3G8_9GAMM|nr:hypothetical protein [Candidatus Thiodiazotropha taylori]MCW4254948.1 hypothetical protein [Candidatus Thiodiazotropha taylori]